jgi:phospholipid-translocating ATPase
VAPSDLPNLPIKCKYEEPSANIYSFKGNLRGVHQSNIKESLSLENVVWASTVLACNPIWGLVIYTGANTRISRNSKLPQSKIGRFDREVDRLAKLLFVLMILLTGVVTLFSQPLLNVEWISVMFIRYLVLLSNIIPVDNHSIVRYQ